MTIKIENIVRNGINDYLYSPFANSVPRTIRYDFRFNMYSEIRKYKHRFEYEAPANPWKIIYISSPTIYRQSREIPVVKGLGQIMSGSWDKDNKTKLCNHYIYNGLEQRFMHNYDWEDTEYYKEAESKFKYKDSWWGYESIDEFRRIRCEFVDDLYQSIRDNGYRANADSRHDVPEIDRRSKKSAYRQALEPLVAIGRDGQVQLCDGVHRVTIAKLLNIDPIPVNVVVRHKQWQLMRDNIKLSMDHRENQHQLQEISHSDLQDIVSMQS